MNGFGLTKKPTKPNPNPRRLLICGDRNWHDVALIKRILRSIGSENIKVVIEGGCRGADVQAREAAKALGIEFLEFPADWNKYPKAAGPIRNRQMIKEGKPTWCIAFHDKIKASKGTKDMLAVAEEHGLRTDLITHKKPYIEDLGVFR